MTDPRSSNKRRRAVDHQADSRHSPTNSIRTNSWETRFYQLQQFKRESRHANPVWEADGAANVNQLACWLQHQRSFFRQGIHLTATQIQRLVHLGCTGFDQQVLLPKPPVQVQVHQVAAPLAPAPVQVQAPPAPVLVLRAPVPVPAPVPFVSALPVPYLAPIAAAPPVVNVIPPQQQPWEQQETTTNTNTTTANDLDSSFKLEGDEAEQYSFDKVLFDNGDGEQNSWGNLNFLPLPIDEHEVDDDDDDDIVPELQMGEDTTGGELKFSERCMELQAHKDRYGQATPLEGSELGDWLKEQKELYAQEKLPQFRLNMLRDIGTPGLEEVPDPDKAAVTEDLTEEDPELKSLLLDTNPIDDTSIFDLSFTSVTTAATKLEPDAAQAAESTSIFTVEPGIASFDETATTSALDGMVTPATVTPPTADLNTTTPAPYAPIAPPIVTPSPVVPAVSVASSAPSVTSAASSTTSAPGEHPTTTRPPPPVATLSPRPLPQPVAQLRPARGATRGPILKQVASAQPLVQPEPAPPTPANSGTAAPTTKPARRMSNSKSNNNAAQNKTATSTKPKKTSTTAGSGAKKTTTTKTTKGKKKSAKNSTSTSSENNSDDELPQTKETKEKVEPVPWIGRFEQLKAFKEERGHTNVSKSRNVSEDERKLFCWLKNQRCYFRKGIKLDDDRIRMLRELGCWGFEDDTRNPDHPDIIAEQEEEEEEVQPKKKRRGRPRKKRKYDDDDDDEYYQKAKPKVPRKVSNEEMVAIQPRPPATPPPPPIQPMPHPPRALVMSPYGYPPRHHLPAHMPPHHPVPGTPPTIPQYQYYTNHPAALPHPAAYPHPSPQTAAAPGAKPTAVYENKEGNFTVDL